MTVDTVTSIIEAVQVILLGSLPTVGVGLLVGLFIAIFQNNHSNTRTNINIYLNLLQFC